MKNDVEDNEWKAETPYMANLNAQNPFGVPDQYFDTLSDRVTSAVYVSEMKNEIPDPGFSVPRDYFSTLGERIAIGALGPDSGSLPGLTGFGTPEHYFDNLKSKILSKTVDEKTSDIGPERIPSTSRIIRLWHSGVLKYASAACFVLISAFGLYLNQHYANEATSNDIANEQVLYDISEQDVIDHVQGTNAEEQKNIPSNAELETYILNNYSQNDLSSSL